MKIPGQRTPDTSRVEELVREHLPLVGHVVREMAMRLPAHVDNGDLSGAGTLGLLQAARAYDPSTGVPFGRYAATRIRGAVLDELRGLDMVSRGVRSRGREMNVAEDSLTAALGRRPSRQEIAEALGVDVAEVDRRRADSDVSVSSLDAPVGGAGEEALARTWAEGLAEDRPGPEELALRAERLRVLGACLDALPERLRAVAVGSYLEQRPMAELAEELGVTESRISQLRTEALGMLREAMHSVLEPALVPAPARPGGAVARRKEAFYAQVALHAAAAGVGSLASQATAREALVAQTA